MPKIVVANRIHPSVEAELRAVGEVDINASPVPWEGETLRERCRDADALMVFMTERIDAQFLAACPRLRIVAGALKGHNNLDVAACTRAGVAVTVVPDLLTEPTAELTVGLMIALARNIGPGDRGIRADGFHGWRPTLYGSSLDGATVGMLGAGAVGRTLLRMLAGFRCERFYFDTRPLQPSEEQALDARFVEQEALIERSDFLVLGLHLMAHNRHLVNRDFLARMKPGAFLVNPARGSLVDEAAVADALETGRLAGYAADTFELEDWQVDERPRHIDPRLLASDRTVFTPHIGSGVRVVRERIEAEAATNIVQYLAGERPQGLVNDEPG